MGLFDSIIGTRKRRHNVPESYIRATNKEDTERTLMVADRTQNAMAARHNMQLIYGKENVPPEFGMRPVIQVRDEAKDGAWTTVTGSNRGIPDTDTQLAALASFRESGIIGTQPINAEGSNSAPQTAMVSGTTSGTASTSNTAGSNDTDVPLAAPKLGYGLTPLESGIIGKNGELAYGEQAEIPNGQGTEGALVAADMGGGQDRMANGQFAASKPHFVKPQTDGPLNRAGPQGIAKPAADVGRFLSRDPRGNSGDTRPQARNFVRSGRDQDGGGTRADMIAASPFGRTSTF